MTCETRHVCSLCGDFQALNDAGFCRFCVLELEERPTDPCAAPDPDDWDRVGGEP